MKDEIIGIWRCYAQKPKPNDDTIVAVQKGEVADLIFESDGTARQVLRKRFSTEEKDFRWKKREDGSYSFFNIQNNKLVIFLRGDIHKNGTLTTRGADPNSKRASIITFYKKPTKEELKETASKGKKKRRGK